jgi:hypothetical protein
MAKLSSKKRKKSLFYKEKSLVGLTPVIHLLASQIYPKGGMLVVEGRVEYLKGRF